MPFKCFLKGAIYAGLQIPLKFMKIILIRHKLLGQFSKMAKIFVRISSNFLHSIRTSICMGKCNEIWGDFGAIFWKKPWAGYSMRGLVV